MALSPNENITPGTSLRDLIATDTGSLSNSGYTYTILKTVETDGSSTYSAVRPDGTVAASSTDSQSPVHSGLKAVLNAVAADNVSIYFPAGFYSFPEDPAGVEDHWAANGYKGLCLEGDASHGTILANWRDDSQPGYDTNPDVEPFSMTRCDDLVYRNFRVWAGGNQDPNNSSDACDFDSCRGTRLENLIIERSRARGIVFDGGDSGAVSRYSHVQNCEIRGVPVPPAVFKGSAGTLAAQEYRYVVTYVDSVYGETPPSEFTVYSAPGGFKARLTVPTGPAYSLTKGVTGRKIYRWSTAQPTYRLVAALDNTVLSYDDDASDASIAAAATVPLAGTPLIPKEGVKLLGSQRHLVMANSITGVGSHGIQIVRKGSGASDNKNSDGHRIIGNAIRHSGAGTTTSSIAGVYIGGGSNNIVQGNSISNPGTPAGLGNGIAIQGLLGAATAYNLIGPNTVVDDQSASSPSGGQSMRYGMQINIAGGGTAPDNTVIVPGAVRGFVTAVLNDASGTNTKQYSETTHTHTGAGGAAPVTPGWKAGNWYGVRAWMAHGTLSGQALTANQLYGALVYVPQDVTVTSIACNVTAAVASSKLRMGIYEVGTDGRPTTLVSGSETSNIASDTTGDKVGTISAALTGGKFYYLSVISDAAISVNGFTGGQSSPMGTAGPGSATKASAVRASVQSGWTALPANHPTASDTAVTLTTEVTF